MGATSETPQCFYSYSSVFIARSISGKIFAYALMLLLDETSLDERRVFLSFMYNVLCQPANHID